MPLQTAEGTPMHYPSEKADALESYVRKTFSLSGTAKHLYSSLRWLEMNKNKTVCATIYAGYREISQEAGIDKKSVKDALQELQISGLVEVIFGSPIKAEKRATQIRRKTLDEIKASSRQGDDDACRLATALFKMKFRFGNKTITPNWSVSKTGRVCSSNLNIQGMVHAKRLAGLKDGIIDGYALVYADIERAEPTIIKYLLKISRERDLYRQYMDATGCSRPDAKEKINMLAYCKNSLACFKHWPEQAKDVLADYVQKLAEYKKDLFVQVRKDRSVTTLTGRLIVAEKGRRLHAGIPLNWRVQATVADIMNAACLRLLDFAITLVPVHDAVYAIVPKDKIHLVKELIIEKAREVGLAIKVETQVYHAGLAVPVSTTAKTTSKPVKLYPKPPPITTKAVRVS